MSVNTAACWMLIIVTIASVNGKPVNMMRTQKRQSDQRVAELETLLALQKYGSRHHFLRAQSAEGGGGGGPFSAAYGIIDFNKIGRKKKSSSSQLPEINDWLLSSLASRPSRLSPSTDMTRFRNHNSWSAQPLDLIPTDDTANLEDNVEK